MPSLKALRKRISSVRNTQQITKAMKMVSAAKLRRAQELVVAARPYANKISELLTRLLTSVATEDGHPLLRVAGEPHRIHLLLITGDRGLCGAYNSTLVRQAEAFLSEHRDRELSMTIVGRKGVEYFKRRNVTIVDRYVQIPGPSVELAREIAAKLAARFVSAEADRVTVLFNAFRSALSQVPTREELLPVARASLTEGESPVDYLIEPDTAKLLDRLLPQYVEVRIYGALLEAAASEHGARMTAMESATKNAAEMILSLTLAMNRARQATITKELMEIVSGAEALKG
jgi:F-type H+-transporting ATPase subunit gamma